MVVYVFFSNPPAQMGLGSHFLGESSAREAIGHEAPFEEDGLVQDAGAQVKARQFRTAQESPEPSNDALQNLACRRSRAEWQAALDGPLKESDKEKLLEYIGGSGRSEAGAFLRAFLTHTSQPLRRAAIRGIGIRGLPEDARLLGKIALQPDAQIEESTEAALALGSSKAGDASAILAQAYSANVPEELALCILAGLAQRPFNETAIFFRQMLANTGELSERKKEVLEALGQYDSVPDMFFVPYMESADSLVRRGAYQGIGKLSESQLGNRLLAALVNERDELARADLYEAMSSKTASNSALLNAIGRAENDPQIRLLAGRAVAASLEGRAESDPAVVDFSLHWIPELLNTALNGPQADGTQALQALSAAERFSGPRRAITQIATEAADPKLRQLAGRVEARLNSAR